MSSYVHLNLLKRVRHSIIRNGDETAPKDARPYPEGKAITSAASAARTYSLDMTSGFFEETKEQSVVKSAIVSKYFWAWAKVIMSQLRSTAKKIAYIDLFAGPGRYKDGTQSTPILVLKHAIDDPDMRQSLVTLFNDKNEDNSRSLEQAIKAVPGIEKLKYKPEVMNEEVGTKIVKMFEEMRFIPTLFFVDPWGYKGLSLKLVNAVVKDWG